MPRSLPHSLRLHLLGLVGLSLMAGCGTSPVVPTGPSGSEDFGASGRRKLGGAAYADFRIAPVLPRVEDTRRAVKLTYLMTDDTKHQSPQSLGMLKMLDDMPQSKVHNLVFRDGKEQGDARLHYLQAADRDPDTIKNPGSPLAPGVTEVASNHPKVFSQVLGYALDQYPARRKYLQIYTHGGGVFGIGTDENQTDLAGKPLPKAEQQPIMRLPELSEALRQGLKGRTLDAIYFRACLMGNVEALYELRGTTRYAIASEDVSYSVDNSNLTMTKLFDTLAAADEEPAELARKLAIAGLGKHSNAGHNQHSGYVTMAAIDIGRLDELKTALNGLARAVLAALPKERTAILTAYDAVPNFGEHEKYQRDLWAFTAQLAKHVKDPGVREAVERTRKAQADAMLHEKDGYGSAANGLSILLPPRTLAAKERAALQQFVKTRYQDTRFAKDSAWDDMLTAVNADAKE
ncbi:MAG: clostripain-related cysteine peptidase [Candidatus Sericytochromatia bacterium]|nr:clostripain-related cysteine peptidase [Candidatus Sericytochromatia bacterium]